MATAKTKAASRSRKKMIADEGARGGFTIIEVVLVLAIAGLIFLMVFIALPALQRSQRDTQRRNDLARVSEAITNYQTNNNGRLPVSSGGTKVQVNAVQANADGNVPLRGTGANGESYGCDSGASNSGSGGVAKNLVCNYLNGVHAIEADQSEWKDPDGYGYGLAVGTYGNDGYTDQFVPAFDYTVHVITKAKCNGESLMQSNNARDYAVMYRMEGSGVYCQD